MLFYSCCIILVERRRRDRINTWISELYKLLPPDEQTKSQYQSKGIVLKRVCEYFQNVDSMLKAANSAVEQVCFCIVCVLSFYLFLSSHLLFHDDSINVGR